MWVIKITLFPIPLLTYVSPERGTHNPEQRGRMEAETDSLWDVKRKDAEETLLANLAQGLSVTDACQCAVVSRSAFYNWMKEEDFAWRVEMAHYEAASLAEEKLLDCAMNADEDPRYQRSLKLYLDRQDARRERISAYRVQQEQSKKEEEQSRRAEEARQAEAEEEGNPAEEGQREKEIREYALSACRRRPGWREGIDEPTPEELDWWREWYARNQAEQARAAAAARTLTPAQAERILSRTTPSRSVSA
jgi:hypothetical protein